MNEPENPRHSTETTPLTAPTNRVIEDLLPANSKLTRATKLSLAAGFGLTASAMAAQAFLGGTYMDADLLHKHLGEAAWAKILRMALFSATVFTAGAGKVAIVFYFSKQNYKNMANPQWWKDMFNRHQWSKGDVLFVLPNAIFTLNASAIFGYLAKLSLDGLPPLIENYSHNIQRTFSWVDATPTQIVAMIPAGMANFFSFPGIHRMILNTGIQTFYRAFETPEYRDIKRQLLLKVDSVRRVWKTSFKALNHDTLKDIYLTLFGIKINFQSLTTLDIKRLKDKIGELDHEIFLTKLLNLTPNPPARYSQLIQTAPEPIPITINGFATHIPLLAEESWSQWLLSNISALTGVTLTGVGLYNFYDIGYMAAQFFFELSGLETDNEAVHYLASTAGAMMFFSMASMGYCATFDYFYNLTNGIFNFITQGYFDHEIPLLSSLKRFFILLFSLIICIWGGTPNARQTVLAGQSLFFTICAFWASNFMELSGLTAMLTSYFENRSTKSILKQALQLEQMRNGKEVYFEEENDNPAEQEEEPEENLNDTHQLPPPKQPKSYGSLTTPMPTKDLNIKKKKRHDHYQSNTYLTSEKTQSLLSSKTEQASQKDLCHFLCYQVSKTLATARDQIANASPEQIITLATDIGIVDENAAPPKPYRFGLFAPAESVKRDDSITSTGSTGDVQQLLEDEEEGITVVQNMKPVRNLRNSSDSDD